ncbi:584288fb-c353-479d-9d6d-7cf215d0ddb8 [Sclerotinia trifoliorum]|uniref:584288fb-c353-479d-9d6d-7cf215d0ddb8 n=1 Tax=Sclerotinia trifoliorum TaxID=28548 RepID=A0A8H2VX58_9HELO|nr:584288fb-c353-479d-9d6d-7cf215d0ddb8 [Sclerotinia trifoliorum]
MAKPHSTLPVLDFAHGSKNLFPPESLEETRQMIENLCIHIKFASKIEKCEKFIGGNNTAIAFTCLPLKAKNKNQRIACILRTPIKNHSITNPPTNIHLKSIVAITQNLRRNFDLPIPVTLAWDCTYENPIRSSYTILERVMGETLEYEYRKLCKGLEYKTLRHPHDLRRRCKYAKCVAEFVAALDRTSLPGYGTFVPHANMPNIGNFTSATSSLQISRSTINGVRIPSEPIFAQWVANVLNARMRKMMDIHSVDMTAEEKFKIHTLAKIGTEMEQKGLLLDEAAVVWHLDFYPRNIMVRSSRNSAMLTGVIDWDDAKAVPRIIARRPPTFLWNINMPENPLLPEEKTIIATAFNEEMERLRPGYLKDAYLGHRVMVRALCVYAFFGVEYRFYRELSFGDLVRRWEEFMGRA